MEFRRFDSSEGNVFKYVFSGNDFVAESVLYRYNSFTERTVICCSTQSGCPAWCSGTFAAARELSPLKRTTLVLLW